MDLVYNVTNRPDWELFLGASETVHRGKAGKRKNKFYAGQKRRNGISSISLFLSGY